MKLYYNSIKLFMVSIIMMANVSCNNETDPVIPVDPITEEIIAPNTYLFQRGGESTVSYGGQTARLDMAASLFNKLMMRMFLQLLFYKCLMRVLVLLLKMVLLKKK